MDTAEGHSLIRVNQAAHCADPGVGEVVSREAEAPRACLWLSLSPPSPFIIGPPVNTPGSRGGHRRGGWRRVRGEQLQCHFLYKWSHGTGDRQGWTKRQEKAGGKKKNNERKVCLGGVRVTDWSSEAILWDQGDVVVLYEVLFLSVVLCSTGNKTDRIHSLWYTDLLERGQ